MLVLVVNWLGGKREYIRPATLGDVLLFRNNQHIYTLNKFEYVGFKLTVIINYGDHSTTEIAKLGPFTHWFQYQLEILVFFEFLSKEK